MPLKYLSLTDPVYEYLLSASTSSRDTVLRELRDETAGLGEIARMQISPEQGAFMGILVSALNARLVLEIGTFTGYSSLCMARALPPEGKLICMDQSREWTDIAKKFWAKAGVVDRIELQLGPAIELLARFKRERPLDLVFIDAEKTQYDQYFELVLPHVRVNGLILFDNMLWGGKLTGKAVHDESGRAIDSLNRKLANDPRVESVLLPIADGLQLCRKI